MDTASQGIGCQVAQVRHLRFELKQQKERNRDLAAKNKDLEMVIIITTIQILVVGAAAAAAAARSHVTRLFSICACVRCMSFDAFCHAQECHGHMFGIFGMFVGFYVWDIWHVCWVRRG